MMFWSTRRGVTYKSLSFFNVWSGKIKTKETINEADSVRVNRAGTEEKMSWSIIDKMDWANRSYANIMNQTSVK